MLPCVLLVAACGNTAPAPTAFGEGSAQPSASQLLVTTALPATVSAAASSAQVAFQACALLTPAQLSKILGVESVQTRPMPIRGWVAGQCAWNGPKSGFFVSVGTAASLTGSVDPDAPDAKAKLAQFKRVAGDRTSKDVAGIGDGAVLTTSVIAAYKGDTYVQVTKLGITDQQVIEIAKLVIAKF